MHSIAENGKRKDSPKEFIFMSKLSTKHKKQIGMHGDKKEWKIVPSAVFIYQKIYLDLFLLLMD